MSITTQQFLISAWNSIVPIAAVLAGTTAFIQNVFTLRKLRDEIQKLQRESGEHAHITMEKALRKFSIRTQTTIGVLVLLFAGLAAASSRVRASLRHTERDAAQSVERAKQEGYHQAEVDASEKERKRQRVLREQIRRLEAENAALRKKAPPTNLIESDAPIVP